MEAEGPTRTPFEPYPVTSNQTKCQCDDRAGRGSCQALARRGAARAAPSVAAGVACVAGAAGGVVVVLSGRKATRTRLAVGAGIGCVGGLAVLDAGATTVANRAWMTSKTVMAAGVAVTVASGWDFWSNLSKEVINGKLYAKIGEWLYTPHAINPMVPRGFGPSMQSLVEDRES